MKRFLTILVNFLLVISLLAPANALAAPGAPGAGSSNLSSEQQVIARAILDAINAHKSETLFYQLYKPKVEQININDTHSLAVAWVTPVDPVTGENVPTEPSTVVAHLEPGGAWTVSLPTSPDYSTQISALPDSLMGRAQRDMLSAPSVVEPQSTTILRGYYLPWLGGTSKTLSGSIWHYLPPGYMSCPNDCHYAYDFWGLSETGADYYFRILASRSGLVSAYYDGWNNGNHGSGSNCDSFVNYMVIKDPTTTPVTYMLYYHLAQGTISSYLRHVGAVVNTGDFIARADDTGCSSGSHVHFMVYSNPYSDHWGKSVDFAFSDVSINDGHPRKCIEVQYYPNLGTQCNPGDLFVSGNRGATPPTGTLTAPAAWTAVTSSTVEVQGSGADNEQIVSLQLAVDYDGTWKAVGNSIIPSPANQVFKNYSFDVSLDLCAAGVPDGPVTLGLWVTDVDGTRTLNAQSPRPIIKNFSCQAPPPSCYPTINQVALFSLPDYQGSCQIYTTGNYDTAALGGIADNTAASIEVGKNLMATVFDATGFNRRAETFDASDPGLEDNRIGVGTISSLKVAPIARPAAPTLTAPHNTTTSALNAADSFLLNWSEAGGGVDFQVALTYPDSTQITSPWLKAKSWSVGSVRAGNYTWTVTARNRAGQTASAPAAFTVAAASLGGSAVSFPYGDNMSSGINHWTATGLWRQTSDTTDTTTPTNYFWVANKSSGGANPSDGSYDSSTVIGSDLTSPPITIPAGSAAYLRFREYLHTESPGQYWDQRLVQISVNDGPFTDFYQMQDDPTDWWVYSPFLDLSAYAGKNVRIRFHFDQVDGYNNGFIGWRVDDVALNTTAPDVSKAEASPNDSTATATPMAMNSSINSFICPAGDLDYYSFSVNAGETVNINIDAQSLSPASGLDTYIFLIDSDGHSVIAENDDEVSWVIRDSNLTYTFHRAGTYYLKVKSWSFPGSSYLVYTCSSFFYTLKIYGSEFAPDVSFTTSTLPWIGASTSDITANIVASPGGLASVDFLWHSPDWVNDAWIKLNGAVSISSTGWKATLDPAGKTIPDSALVLRATDRVGLSDTAWVAGLQTDTTPPTTQLTGPTTNNLSTVIPLAWTASDAGSGLKSLGIEYQDITVGGGWQPWNVTLPGTARQAFFLGTPGHTYGFRIHGIDALGNVEAYSTDPQIQTAIAATCAPDILDDAPGDNSAATAQPLVLNTPQTHNFCPSGDQDWVSLSLPLDGSYHVRVMPVSSGAAMQVAITSPDGNTILLQQQSSALGTGVDFKFTVPAGKYRMQITALNPNLWGTDMTYSVEVGAGNWVYFPLLRK